MSDTMSHADWQERMSEDGKEARSEQPPTLIDLLEHLQRLERQNQAFEAACTPERLRALDELLAGVRGKLGAAEGNYALHAALFECRSLLRDLRAAVQRANKGADDA
jgi:hypothetical protein